VPPRRNVPPDAAATRQLLPGRQQALPIWPRQGAFLESYHIDL